MCNRRSAGFTLVEMILAIVIIGAGLAGVLAAFQLNVRSSADPLIRKQMLAIAEEMMEEILLKPFAVSGVPPANAATACGAAAVRSAFDDVSDYHNYETTAICDIDGTAVAGLAGYSLKVTVVANTAVATDLAGLPAGTVKKVNVVVTRDAEILNLVGWRANYAS
jgi:MSHA pilin protein MshD